MKKDRSVKQRLFSAILVLVMLFTSLLGTTFAWFTDQVSSAGHQIVSGTLKVDLLHKTDDDWISLKQKTAHKIFDYAHWEPGYTRVEALKVENLGTLALQYKLSLSIAPGSEKTGPNGENLADVIQVYYTNTDATPANFAVIKDTWTHAGTLSDVMNSPATFIGGQLTPDGKQGDEQLLTIALHMDENAGNEYQNLSVGNIYVNLVATQWTYESDSFDENYDEDSIFPEMNGVFFAEADVTGKVNNNNELTEDVTVGDPNGDKHAIVRAGTLLEPGTTKLVLTVGGTERSGNIQMTAGQVSRSFDVHISGISEQNTVPATIDLGEVMPKDYKDSSIELYHVENGTPIAMSGVDAMTAHNQYIYTAENGGMAVNMATFSEVTVVVAAGDPWAGGVDTSWYNATNTEFTLITEEQFAGFAQIVGGMASGIKRDNFAGKTVKLGADLDLGSKNGKIFTPVGYYFTNDKNENKTPNENAADVYSDVYSFEGTFDGQGHTISNILQRTWDIPGDDPHYSVPAEQYYNDGMGIFGFVYNGTVKDLIVNNFQSDGEFCTTGCVAAYASGTSTFENIKVVNSNPRAYNVPNGGVVGYAYAESGANNVITFNNIEVGPSNKITALWGSWDVGCGGILGRVNGETTVNMTGCTVGAVIDVYNDVCGNYQYYQYRYAGMLIGTVGGDTDPLTGGETVSFSDVKVYIGNWADYYYCEFEKNSVGSYTTDFQFSRVERNEINIDPTTNLPYKQNLSPCRHTHTSNEDKMGTYLPFDQLYTGYGWGSSPVRAASGVEVIKYFYTVTYMDGEGKNVLDTEYVTVGERSDSKLWANAHTVKSNALTTNGDKQFVGWVNSNSVKTASIPAGNYKDVVLYESWENPYIIRFVNLNGEVVYSEAWTSSNQGLSFTPEVPKIDGYVGSWEDGWQTKLQNVTSDVTIKPIYVLEEYADEQNKEEHVVADSDMDAKKLFQYIAEGKSVVMGADITGSGKNLGINGSNNNLCEVASGKHGRLNLNSYTLTCEFDHDANNDWHVFYVNDGATLTIAKGVADDGRLLVNFPGIKSNVYLFDVQPGGKLILEAGVTIEINYTKHQSNSDVSVYGFLLNGELNSFADYNGIYVDKSVEGKIIITVGVTTTITVSVESTTN